MSCPGVAAERDVFLASFQGELIECATILDAVAVKTADSILAGRFTASRPRQLERLAAVMSRYGRPGAADSLLAEARRMRGLD
jgi:hypothetical protein